MKRRTDMLETEHRRMLDSHRPFRIKSGTANGEVANRAAFRRQKTAGPITITVILLCLIAGCTTLDFSKRIPWLDSDAIANQPTRITVLWTHTVLNEPGKKGVRGFGGRIMFHSKDQDKPVKVAGTLTVYAFDVTTKINSVPDRKFVFTEEQFETHYSQSKLGHTYSIWLPWDEVGGAPRKINLMARFESSKGSGMIMSEDSLQILPGITTESSEETGNSTTSETSSSGIQQAGYQQPSPPSPLKQTLQRTSLTDSEPIDLPPSFSRRLGPTDTPSKIVPKRTKTAAESSEPVTDVENQSAGEIKDPLGASLGKTEPQFTPPAEQLMERQKELVNHFGPRKSRAQKASTVRSKTAAVPNQLRPGDEPSVRPRSSSLEAKDPFDSDDSPGSAGSR